MTTVLLLAGQLFSCSFFTEPYFAESVQEEGALLYEGELSDIDLIDTDQTSEDTGEADLLQDEIADEVYEEDLIIEDSDDSELYTDLSENVLFELSDAASDEEVEELTEASADAAEDAIDMDVEGLIEEIGDPESDEDAEKVYMMEENIQIDDPVVAASSDDTEILAEYPALMSASSYADSSFTGCFYDQLDSVARAFYDFRYEQFGTNKVTTTATKKYTKSTQIYKFMISSDYISLDEEEKPYINDAAALRLTDEYRAGYESLLYELRASFDAICFDHPEIFWTRSTKMNIGYGLISEDSSYYLYLSKLEITPVEAFSGASDLITAFEEGVSAAAAEIKASCDYNEDGTLSEMELLQGIHDHICGLCYYDYSGLSEYLNNQDNCTDYHIFTPCGVFVESVGRGIVCEGYSKAFKILCDQLGLSSILMIGKQSASSTLAHEWNAVCSEGEWFLTDLTNDDARSSYTDIRKYTYFMCPEISGRVYTYELGGDETTDDSVYAWVSRPMTFVYPDIVTGSHSYTALNSDQVTCGKYVEYNCDEDQQVSCWLVKQHVYELVSDEIPATCTDDGTTAVYACTCCGAQTGGSTIAATGHTFTEYEQVDATCTENGHKAGRICKTCGYTEGMETIDATGHTFTEYEEVAATCTQEGREWGRICETCGYTEGLGTIAALGHSYDILVTEEVEATCTEPGSTAVYECVNCGDKTGGDVLPATGHSFVEFDEIAPTCTQEGTGAGRICETCGYSEGLETIPATGHSFENGICKTCGAYDLSAATIDSISSQCFYYKAVTPKLTVRIGNVTLKEGTDYKVVYSSNKAIGDAKAEIRALGENVGSRSVTFQIIPQKIKLKRVVALSSGKLKAVWKKITGITKYQLQISTTKSFKSYRTVQASGSASAKKIGKLKHKKKYYVRIRAYKTVNGKRYYGPWSSGIKVKTK